MQLTARQLERVYRLVQGLDSGPRPPAQAGSRKNKDSKSGGGKHGVTLHALEDAMRITGELAHGQAVELGAGDGRGSSRSVTQVGAIYGCCCM